MAVVSGQDPEGKERETMTSQIKGLQEEIRRLNVDKGWRGQDPPIAHEGPWFAAYIALAHSELSEALEEYREKRWSSQVGDFEGEIKPIGVGPELADVFIRILDMCDIWGIDLEYEVNRVLRYGWTRPYRHGGKQL